MFVISHHNYNTHSSLYGVTIGEEIEKRDEKMKQERKKEKKFCFRKTTQQQYYTDTTDAIRLNIRISRLLIRLRYEAASF